MDKENVMCMYMYIHTHNGILLRHYKEILPFEFMVIWMDIEGIMLSEISHTKKDKLLYDFTFMCKLKNKTNEKTKQTHR